MKSAARPMESLGARLRYVRGDRSQAVFAQELGVAVATYRNYESDVRVPDTALAAALVGQGWNANWLLTGDGPERLEALQDRSQADADDSLATSHEVSEDNLIIALELADEAVAATIGADRPPRLLYGRLLRLLYEGITHGLPVAEVRSIGGQFARALSTGRVSSDDSEKELGRTGKQRSG
ncbi:helix-turn-helix domain-containing protein [Pseudoxanthomonas sp. UTMC 1351]|uniref:helix-turn-helix domain-containing protein n=1 Tax=Pseudoxanthomonas sp. UTMC 1351 TaxID=2695853 RepID=UPI0034CFFAF2